MRWILVRPQFLLLVLSSVLSAQTTTSTISGLVQDSSGAAVPKAQVNILNAESGVSTPTVSNDAGLYRAGGLIPGPYRIEAQAAGFQKLVRTGVTVQIAQTLQVDLILQVGDV